jgi:nicotinamide-nucleotide amidase
MRFARRNLAVTERVKRQAQVPRGATVLPNRNGTAPGLYFPQSAIRNPHLFLLPGPPRELRPMFNDSVLPVLKKIAPSSNALGCRTYRLAGLGESQVEHLVGEELLAISRLELGYCARVGEVDVRCIGAADVLEKAHAIVVAKLKPYIVSETGELIEQAVVKVLVARAKKIATAESCTGGALANRITNVSGASETFLAGFVTYANEAKTRALGVEAELIREFGAVSREVAAAMAEGALRASGADFGLSTTGIAGPTGGTAQKPVGTVFIGIAFKNAPTEVEQHLFATDRETFKQLTTQTALDLLRKNL